MGIRLPRISISADYGDESSLGDISLLAVGYGIHQAWIYSTMFGAHTIFEAPTLNVGNTNLSVIWLISIVVYAICLLFAAFTDEKFLRFYTSRKTLIAAAVITAVSSSAIIGASYEGTLGLASTIIGGVGTGLGSALLILFWGTAFAREETGSIVANTAVAVVVGIAIYSMVLHQIAYPFAGILASLLPIIACVFLWKKTPVSYSVRHAVPVFNFPQMKRWKFVLKFGIPVFLFGVALGLLRERSVQYVLPSSDEFSQLLILVAAGIATVLILITSFMVGRNEQWNLPFRVLVPFVALSVFFIPFAGSGNLLFADLILLVAYMCFEALMWIFFGEVSQSYRISPIFVFGLGRGCMAIGSTLGSSFALDTSSVALLPFGEAGIAVIILLAMVIAYSLLPRSNDIKKLMVDQIPSDSYAVRTMNEAIEKRVRLQSPKPNEEDVTEQTALQGSDFRNRCEVIANRYMLSRRETEVLFFLARGNNSAYIQEKLFISEGTAKTHMRHIYRKLDVHSQHEIICLVDEQELSE